MNLYLIDKTPPNTWSFDNNPYRNLKLSNEIISNLTEPNWESISKYQKLSDSIIRQFSDKIDWDYISMYQHLSEDIVKEFENKVNWYCIFKYQPLSEEFIRQYKHKSNLEWISKYQRLSSDFIKEFKVKIPEKSWIYQSDDWKEEYIRNNTSFKIINNEVEAYKACRYAIEVDTKSVGIYSIYNFQFKYKPGHEYNCHADCVEGEYDKRGNYIRNENSFGISASTIENAINYYNTALLYKVRINIKDIACIVNNVIRASKVRIICDI